MVQYINKKRVNLMRLFSIVTICCCFFSSVIIASPQVMKISSLSEINLNPSEYTTTIYYFDIDDTIFDSPYMFGSKSWRKYIANVTKPYNDETHNWHDIFTLFLAKKLPMQLVEPTTAQFILALQNSGANVFALTSRERNKWYNTSEQGIDVLTVDQLKSVDVDFTLSSVNPVYLSLIEAPEYYKGVFFADTDLKGDYLLKLFKNSSFPTKVVFVDDKESQVRSVAEALEKLGIECDCYYYVATDKKVKQFNPLASMIQFYYFWNSDGNVSLIFSDEEAKYLVKPHPTDDKNHSHEILEKGYLESMITSYRNSELIHVE